MNYRLSLAAVALLSLAGIAVAQDSAAPPLPPTTTPPPASRPAEDRDALEGAFIKKMSGCTLVGFFSDSNDPDKPPRAERYVITKVTKGNGDLFVFFARFQMKNGEINLPLPIPVKWAGDTAVITVTKMGIPGMGTYTARVMIYEDQYAGMWMGTGHGGQMWGKIEPLKEVERPAPDKTEPTDPPAK